MTLICISPWHCSDRCLPLERASTRKGDGPFHSTRGRNHSIDGRNDPVEVDIVRCEAAGFGEVIRRGAVHQNVGRSGDGCTDVESVSERYRAGTIQIVPGWIHDHLPEDNRLSRLTMVSDPKRSRTSDPEWVRGPGQASQRSPREHCQRGLGRRAVRGPHGVRTTV